MSEPATVTSPYAPDVDDVRRWLEKMVKAMRLVELVAAIIALVTRMRDINTELTRRLADARRKRPRSEKLRRIEGQMVFAFGVIVPVASSSTLDDPDSGVTVAGGGHGKKRGRGPGRSALPKDLPRVTDVNHVPPSLRTCPLCGATMRTVSHAKCEILDVRPAELYVRQRLDETVACPVRLVLRREFALQPEALASAVARTMGFERLGERLKDEITRAVARVMASGDARVDARGYVVPVA